MTDDTETREVGLATTEIEPQPLRLDLMNDNRPPGKHCSNCRYGLGFRQTPVNEERPTDIKAYLYACQNDRPNLKGQTGRGVFPTMSWDGYCWKYAPVLKKRGA